jgi:uncharacterized protein with GYD domain
MRELKAKSKARPGKTYSSSIDDEQRKSAFGVQAELPLRVGKQTRADRWVARKKEDIMPKFLIKASYNAEGARGLLKEGGSARRAVVENILKGLGGKLEAFYYAYGEDDAYVITDVPDATAGLAVSLAVNASGAVRLTTIPLITPEEIDAASKKAVSYRAPGA